MFQAQEEEYLVFFLISGDAEIRFSMIDGFEKGYGCQMSDSFIHRFNDKYETSPTVVTF